MFGLIFTWPRPGRAFTCDGTSGGSWGYAGTVDEHTGQKIQSYKKGVLVKVVSHM